MAQAGSRQERNKVMADFATDFKAWIMEQASWTNDELKVVNEETEQEYFNFLSGGLAMIEAVQEWIINRH